MKAGKYLVQGLLTAALTLSGGLATAASVTFDFTHHGSQGQSSGTGYGNNIRFEEDGLSLKVKSYADTGSGNTLQSAEVYRWGTGLGSCNRKEGSVKHRSCSGPAHQVDNVGSKDFTIFRFQEQVSFESITVDPYGRYDRDLSYWVGTLDKLGNLVGSSLNQLSSLGFGARQDTFSNPSSNPLTVGLSGVGNVLMVGASVVNGYTGNDRFKISNLTVAPVPLPAAAWFFLTGIAALVWQRRRAQAKI